MKNTLQLLTVIFSVFLLSACSGPTKPAQANVDKEEITKDTVEKEVREFVYPLPSAFEVTEMLKRIEAAYILSLSNSVENVDKYLTTKSQALNLGVYSADISYASTYNKKQETIDFMNVSNILISKLDLQSAIDPELLPKVEKNLDNKDELVRLITNSFYDTYEYLNQNDRSAVSIMILAGSWVEALYISSHISEDTFDNKEMIKIIMEQKEPLVKLLTILETYNTDDDVLSILEDLKPIKEIYEQMEMGSISAEQLTAIKVSIATVREKFVS